MPQRMAEEVAEVLRSLSLIFWADTGVEAEAVVRAALERLISKLCLLNGAEVVVGLEANGEARGHASWRSLNAKIHAGSRSITMFRSSF